MPDDASVVNGPKLGKIIYGNIGAGHINAMRAFLRAFDQLIQGSVIQVGLNTPPGTPANGDAYIIGSAPTGAWAGQPDKVVVWSTEIATIDTDTKVPAWEFYPPQPGWIFYSEADDAFQRYDGTNWTFAFKFAGIPKFGGPNTTGAGSALLGGNSPATIVAAPYTWIEVKTADGTVAWIPAWK